MPELPEVETTRRGIAPHIEGERVREVVVRQPRLRWPVPVRLKAALCGQTIDTVHRRGKYLLLRSATGTVILHLGMSGSLHVVAAGTPAGKHDHVDIIFTNGCCLRLRDPRRFGAVLWTTRAVEAHKLLQGLGPEPLSDSFDTDYLLTASRARRVSIKAFIMDSKVVVGVGNIYASESLFMAGIHPKTAAGRIGRVRYERLVRAIKQVLDRAIEQGGTTLRDFTNSEGKPGYFQQQLRVYGRAGEACLSCNGRIRSLQLGQRNTFYCPQCQH
ncbi:MAG: bifunctional DNA-formamidopyrimidine glycosylase/DNA-(apurinic or apyrimidinic site) lyase [Gammaproteobacteria bacterium]|nr:bifunctional DNA-formamidopyrimidine glycosylase/DNA-(apurinic or apyrimidinic site) lyase [Gammaproteobacteria bacterium]MCF6363021.1 bifunctional DNA-formamidopyrimidine glycosylase/DNA-(apurinic or apyrimidinic site) lyase [Gammaproteobacteria bacterium]